MAELLSADELPEVTVLPGEAPLELPPDWQPPSVEHLGTEFLENDDLGARRDLRVQIARMEAELGELFGSAFPRMGIEFGVAAPGGPRILSVDELERVRDALAARLQDVRGELHDRTYVEEQNRKRLEHLVAEPDAHRWVRISNEDIGEPGCRHWHSRPRWGLLGLLLNWWRVKVSSGCPLAMGRG
jgi:hypothetical protein